MDSTDSLKGPFTVVFQDQEDPTVVLCCIKVLETAGEVSAFIEGKGFNFQEYAVVHGKVIKKFGEALNLNKDKE